jgi:hypothetical protein
MVVVKQHYYLKSQSLKHPTPKFQYVRWYSDQHNIDDYPHAQVWLIQRF